jgi:hypothetical protein
MFVFESFELCNILCHVVFIVLHTLQQRDASSGAPHQQHMSTSYDDDACPVATPTMGAASMGDPPRSPLLLHHFGTVLVPLLVLP